MESFEEIVKDMEPMIFSLIRQLRIYKNRDEFYQIGLIALWDAYKRFDERKGKFSSFAYSYIKGRMLNALTKDAKLDEKTVHISEKDWISIPFERDPLWEWENLLTYCKGLTEKQKKWVILNFWCGYSIKEIAEMEGVSETAVKKWRQGAIQKIRQNILEEW